MQSLITQLVQRRNPTFQFDTHLDAGTLISFILNTGTKVIRGWRLLLYFRNPKRAILGKRIRFSYLHKIRWGSRLKLGDNVHLSGLGKTGLLLGHNVSIGSHSSLIVSTTLNHMGSHIRIGNHVGLGEYAYLGGAGGLEIGNECIIGQYFSCHPENHHYSDLETSIRHQGVSRKGIRIGDNCWIGSKVTILDGVSIGKGSVVAAGAVVHQSFPENSVIAGVPARLIKTRKL